MHLDLRLRIFFFCPFYLHLYIYSLHNQTSFKINDFYKLFSINSFHIKQMERMDKIKVGKKIRMVLRDISGHNMN